MRPGVSQDAGSVMRSMYRFISSVIFIDYAVVRDKSAATNSPS